MSEVRLILGDCVEELAGLEAGSVQCCVTSPPYFGLRDYGADGQIGLEETPEAYVAELVAVFREVRRVLRDDGTVWLNLGDSYTSSAHKTGNVNNSSSTLQGGKSTQASAASVQGKFIYDTKPKDLIGIPWRVAFALQADGWYLRQDIIWHKPNPMPESVTDRCTKAHEYVFLLTKSKKYYYDAEAVAEKATDVTGTVRFSSRRAEGGRDIKATGNEGRSSADQDARKSTRNRRSVWTVATQPFTAKKFGFDVDHFATYPPALIEPCILAGTSAAGQCPQCGAPWERVVGSNGVTFAWVATCTCEAGDPIPQTVLDPFNGAGTTGLVSIQHRRNYIGIDLNADYLAITRARLAEVQPRLL